MALKQYHQVPFCCCIRTSNPIFSPVAFFTSMIPLKVTEFLFFTTLFFKTYFILMYSCLDFAKKISVCDMFGSKNVFSSQTT